MMSDQVSGEQLPISAPEVQTALSQAYAFLGNSLLVPMSRTDASGLEVSFWDVWPLAADDPEVAAALDVLKAHGALVSSLPRDEAVQRVSVEFTHLFIGPPHPLAPPWETMNPEGRENTIGFGQATFDMKGLLREAGVRVANDNHQYEDHIGIELLYLSTLCQHASVADGDALTGIIGQQTSFIAAHPLFWIGRLSEKVARAYPHGYYVGLISLTRALLAWHVAA